MYRAVVFDHNNTDVIKLLVNTKDDAMFIFDKYDEGKINKMNLRGRSMWDTDATTMISYFAEIAYDVMISPIDNVSMNPGFESCHGVW